MHSDLKAILGPTNTGKTHLAVERMCGHSSGMIGFPLRLLAREVYDRVVKAKGVRQVALVTGEEKILPDQARWFCCTAESMPMEGCRLCRSRRGALGSDPGGPRLPPTDLPGRVRERRYPGLGDAEAMVAGASAQSQIVTSPLFRLSLCRPTKLPACRRAPRRRFFAEQSTRRRLLRRMRGGARW